MRQQVQPYRTSRVKSQNFNEASLRNLRSSPPLQKILSQLICFKNRLTVDSFIQMSLTYARCVTCRYQQRTMKQEWTTHLDDLNYSSTYHLMKLMATLDPMNHHTISSTVQGARQILVPNQSHCRRNRYSNLRTNKTSQTRNLMKRTAHGLCLYRKHRCSGGSTSLRL